MFSNNDLFLFSENNIYPLAIHNKFIINKVSHAPRVFERFSRAIGTIEIPLFHN